ncbi:hypothetical protein LX15_005892 [Streptoalloteichus tenebrarius]|uniref:Uncharacterized protein n=1 Tax=Streptoalloteichus tenebrarius (strain ATCC 17920 / DSM 40477 / JCM 4838 / CBS 697.72 / NBRC 16177 / NCIMB 11028 / NRRL B-12390 / A12253. 1 / ISP 5477) TaxID=1933 RepID=A0ABT1I2Z1_STRSD|nr:DUF6228 family protein [Streptoalloteichus tenebrarius]MCP2262158.1 hypothetical protein [Streptoalloteichus tenebrarius]BFF00039.1 hypothetical protein GCM10020241_17140 [Streptoalloteichus tenebrarius]
MDDQCQYDPDLHGKRSVVLHGYQGTYVRFYNRRRPDHHIIYCCVEVGGPGMRGELHDYVEHPNSDLHLAAFLDELGRDFGTWTGVRSWHSPNYDLFVDAKATTEAHVELTWTIRPWRHSIFGYWSVSVTTDDVESAERMRTLAADMDDFLGPDEEPWPEDDGPHEYLRRGTR